MIAVTGHFVLMIVSSSPIDDTDLWILRNLPAFISIENGFRVPFEIQESLRVAQVTQAHAQQIHEFFRGGVFKKCYKCDSLWTAFSKKKLHVPIVLDGNFVNCALTGYVILVS